MTQKKKNLVRSNHRERKALPCSRVNMSSVRVSLVEGKVDPKARATKKVKPRDTSDIEPGLTVERPQGAVTVEKTVSF